MSPSKMKAILKALRMLLVAGSERSMSVLMQMAEEHPDTLLRILKIEDGGYKEELLDLCRAGDTIKATKLYREKEGCDLKEAKTAIDTIMAKLKEAE